MHVCGVVTRNDVLSQSAMWPRSPMVSAWSGQLRLTAVQRHRVLGYVPVQNVTVRLPVVGAMMAVILDLVSVWMVVGLDPS